MFIPATHRLCRFAFAGLPALLLALLFGGRAEAGDAQGRLFFFGVAVDNQPPAGKSLAHYDYAPDNFTRLLTAQAKDLFREIRTTTIKGKDATREKVLAGLKQVAKEVAKDDLLFVYWGTHGSTDANGWSAAIAAGESMLASEIKAELAAAACPVLMLVSTCGSGGFAERGEAPLPPNLTALCACRSWQSTDNELDVSLLEALAGFGDLDRDGLVTLGEALEYVPRRYRDWTDPGELPAIQRLPVVGRSALSPLARPLTKASGERAMVVYRDRWYGAEVLERKGEKYKVRFLGFDTTCLDGSFSLPDRLLAKEQVFLPGGDMPLEVEWYGHWYPARLLERTAEGCRIHYIGYPASEDETVPHARVRVPYAGVAPQVAREK